MWNRTLGEGVYLPLRHSAIRHRTASLRARPITLRKSHILAVLLAGDPLFRFDNIEQPLGGPALNILLSEGVYKERLLGKSSMMDAPTNCLMLATGNNVEVEADTTGRTVRCRMDARHERPQDRTFKPNPLAEATQHRGELVVAGLTILLAYLHAGCPGFDTINHVGGFEDWSLIRRALKWLGQPDPADTMLAISADDPERDEILQMMFAWEAMYEGRGGVSVEAAIALRMAYIPAGLGTPATVAIVGSGPRTWP
jgi:hypothetical protein